MQNNNPMSIETKLPTVKKVPINYVEWCYLFASSVLVFGVIVYGATFFEERARWGAIFLALSMIISSLQSLDNIGIGKTFFRLKGKWNTFIVGITIILTIISAVYFYSEYLPIIFDRAGMNNLPDYLFGSIIIILAMLYAIKDQGYAIPSVATVFILYMLFGKYLPGIFFHAGLSISRLLRVSVLEFDGIFGLITKSMATEIAIFLVFAGLLEGFGKIDYSIKLIRKIAGRSTNRIPQVAVFGSMLFGSFSGSAAANVAGTGSVTIPLMKKYGMPPAEAGAIEAVASSGGQIMPPVMGAAAFLMMEFLGKTYWDIVVIAILPAVVFYLSVSFSVYLMSKIKMSGNANSNVSESQDLHVSFIEGIPLFLPLILFIFVMAVFRVNVMPGGVILNMSFLVSQFLCQLILDKKIGFTVKKYFFELQVGIKRAAYLCATLAPTLAVLGIIVRGLVVSGLSQRLAFGMVDLAGGNMFVLLLLVTFLSILFGMAVSTVATYLVVVILAAPALQQLGVDLVVSHFAVFYLSMLSAITPPVAMASTVAAGLSGASLGRTCVEAMKLGLSLFLLPFVFVTYPNILIGSSFISRLLISFIVLLVLVLINFGLQWSSKGTKNKIIKVCAIVVGLFLVFYDFIL